MEEEEDEWNKRITKTGCRVEYEAMLDCHYEKKDYRKCVEEMKKFKECFAKNQQLEKDTGLIAEVNK
jgi:cytochrome c oxidase assembly factor 4